MKVAPFSLFVSLLLPICAVANTAYTWVDENGVLHISDAPPSEQVQRKEKIRLPSRKAPAPEPVYHQPKAIEDLPENFDLEAINTLPAGEPSSAPNAPASRSLPSAADNLDELDIALDTPNDQQTIHHNSGLITVALEASRDLQVGESYQLLLNDNRYGAPQHIPFWELKNIERGSHTIKVVAKESGKVIASTRTITVHLHRGRVK